MRHLTLITSAFAATVAALTFCGTRRPATVASCAVARPPHLSASVVPPRDELKRLLANAGERYAGSLVNPMARQRFRTRLGQLQSSLATDSASQACQAFVALSGEFQRVANGVPAEPRNAFALVLDLTAAAISRQTYP